MAIPSQQASRLWLLLTRPTLPEPNKYLRFTGQGDFGAIVGDVHYDQCVVSLGGLKKFKLSKLQTSENFGKKS